jgi:hypothetical protein
MLKTTLVGARGGVALRVEPEGTLNAVIHPHPPRGETLIAQPFREYFIDSNDSNDLRADGSSTSVEYSIGAVKDFDIYIKTISLVIGDGGSPSLNKFGSLSALTNGVRWSIFSNELGDYTLHDGIKTNLEFVRLGIDTGAIGTGTDAYLADVSGGGTEKSYLPTIDLQETFGLTFGLRLRAGTADRLTFTIQDNLTALTTFNAIGYGIRI